MAKVSSLYSKSMNQLHTAKEVTTALQTYAHPEDALFLQRFFKTGPGQYGEGDKFIGVRMPMLRRVTKLALALPASEVQQLLSSSIHEHRLAGAVILTYQYPLVDRRGKRAIYTLYLKNVRAGQINNWDIVDVTAENVIGRYLCEYDLSREILFALAKSNSIWQKRVAVISSFYFFRDGGKDAATTIALCGLLLNDPHDLIQKVVGWMLREVGKRVDRQTLLQFLDTHAAIMPRTTLRYAIEHLDPAAKAHYMGMRAKG